MATTNFRKPDIGNTQVGMEGGGFSIKVVDPDGTPVANSIDKVQGVVNLGQSQGSGYTPQITSDVARSIMDTLDVDSSLFDSNKPLNMYRLFMVIETMTQRVPEIFSLIRSVSSMLTGSPIVTDPIDPTNTISSTKEIDTLQFLKRNNIFNKINEWTLHLVTYGNLFLYFRTHTDKFFECPHKECGAKYISATRDDLQIKVVENSQNATIPKPGFQMASRLKVFLITCPFCGKKAEHSILPHPDIRNVMSESISDNEGAHSINILPLRVSDVSLSKPQWYSNKVITVKFPDSKMNASLTANRDIVRLIKQHDLITLDAIINNEGSLSVEERNGGFNHSNLAHFSMSDATSTINNGWAIPTLSSFLDDYFMLRYYHQADQANAIEHTNLMYLLSPTDTDVSYQGAMRKAVEAIRVKRAERGAIIALSQPMQLTRLGGESKTLFTTELQDYIVGKLTKMFGVPPRFTDDDFMFGASGADFHFLSEQQKFRITSVNQVIHWVLARYRSQNENLRGLKDVEFHPLDTEKKRADVRELFQLIPDEIPANALIEAYGIDQVWLDKKKKEADEKAKKEMEDTIAEEVSDRIKDTGEFSLDDMLDIAVEDHLDKIKEIVNSLPPDQQGNNALLQQKANDYLSSQVTNMNLRNAILGEFNRELQANQQQEQ